MTAALNHKTVEDSVRSAFLGVEQSVRGFRWVERLEPSRAATALAIAQTHGLPELLGRILAARGAEAATLHHYLDPSLRHLLPDPACLRDMDQAAERFARAIRDREPVAVFGDYDVDGAASVALVARFLRAHGQEPVTYIPDRLTEGYGPSPTSLAGLAEDGAKLILTVDCGTTAGAATAAARAAGADVIVIDHHQADESLPPAFAVLNPNRQDDLSGLGHLAAAGVVFLFLVATARELRHQGFYADRSEPDLLSLLDLVALATVCDVVPLKGVNRALVAKGLKVLRLRHHAGLRALSDVARIDAAPTCFTLGFILGPRINAGGRVGASGLGAKLLATDDADEARLLAARLDQLNTERKAIEERMLEEATARAEQALEASDRPYLWLDGEAMAPGPPRSRRRPHHRSLPPSHLRRVLGRRRSGRRLGPIDRSRRSRVGDQGCGSCRALGEGRRSRHGGRLQARAAAAGRAARLPLRAAGPPRGRSDGLQGTRHRRGALLWRRQQGADGLVDKAGPYGQGHPEPRFAFPAHRVTRLRLLKGQHLRCTLIAADGARIEAVAFRAGDAPLAKLMLASDGATLHVAGHLRRDRWNGRDGVELIIDDAAPAMTRG